MYKRILVPVDGSDISINALQEAIKLAKIHKSELKIIYIANE